MTLIQKSTCVVAVLLTAISLSTRSTAGEGAASTDAAQAGSPGERFGGIPAAPPPADSAIISNMMIRPVGPGQFAVGKVQFSKTDRTVSFPAVVNMSEGPVEYLLVTGYGKLHESVLSTMVEPYYVHMAMLLLDAKGSTWKQDRAAAGEARPGPSPISQPGSRAVDGDKVEIEVKWDTSRGGVQCGAAELVFNNATRSAMAPGPWVYNGSSVFNGIFLAQVDGSLVSLISDTAALMNNPRPGFDNDEIWMVNTNRTPSRGTPVEVTLRLVSPEKAAGR